MSTKLRTRSIYLVCYCSVTGIRDRAKESLKESLHVAPMYSTLILLAVFVMATVPLQPTQNNNNIFTNISLLIEIWEIMKLWGQRKDLCLTTFIIRYLRCRNSEHGEICKMSERDRTISVLPVINWKQELFHIAAARIWRLSLSVHQLKAEFLE